MLNDVAEISLIRKFRFISGDAGKIVRRFIPSKVNRIFINLRLQASNGIWRDFVDIGDIVAGDLRNIANCIYRGGCRLPSPKPRA